MRSYFVLITSSSELIKGFLAAGEALIPKEIRQQFPEGSTFIFDAFDPARLGVGFSVERHLLERTRHCDYIAGFIEKDLLSVCGNVRHALLSAGINLAEVPRDNFRNFFSNRLTKLVRAIVFTRSQMASAEIEQAMRLPIRNFVAPELKELCRVYREDILDTSFHNQAKTSINALRKRRQPRRRSSFPDKYFIDDDDRYFAFGREIHERLPTGPPHQSRCELNGRFRFGRLISIDQHFNVSEGEGNQTTISGQFLNCHDASVVPEKGRTHLNMFSNDHC